MFWEWRNIIVNFQYKSEKLWEGYCNLWCYFFTWFFCTYFV